MKHIYVQHVYPKLLVDEDCELVRNALRQAYIYFEANTFGENVILLLLQELQKIK